ncbi:MAG: trypsin-like serine protease [Acholeplasmataceae bacterium]|jgi:serine protease Do|nr:trypsin-like serine protease [Acholeplasmataceae bacterium]
MKKFFLILLLIFLTGCKGVAVNEIYNKTYNVGEISIATLEEAVMEVADNASRAVVGVSKYKDALIGQKLEYTGSGVIYECRAEMKDGTTVSNCENTLNSQNEVKNYLYYVVTNRHVLIGESASLPNSNTLKVKVYLGDEGLSVDANVIQYDDKVDLAVLSFKHYSYIQPLAFADSDAIRRGSFVIAIGNPAGHDYYGSTTFGIVSYKKRYINDDVDWTTGYIQHDAAINSGNSGGALLNLEGKLIGINTLKLSSSDMDNIYENMGFAIPSNLVREIIDVLETGSRPVRRTIGIETVNVLDILNYEDNNIDPNDFALPEGVSFGLYVHSVSPGRPASGKLQPGDIIQGIAGQEIRYVYEFRDILNSIADNEVVLTVIRGGQTIDITLNF